MAQDKRAQQLPRSQRAREAILRQQNLARPVPLCAYCGVQPGTTRDHVVARGFFGKPYPINSIIVPACKDCNAGRGDGGHRHISLDEEYARTIFCANYGNEKHPAVQKLLADEIPKSYVHSPAFAQMMLNSAELGEVRLPSGLIVPDAVALNVDLSRLVRVITKITRGLFHEAFRRSLPRDRQVFVAPVMQLAKFRPLNELIGRIRKRSPWFTIGQTNAFRFRTATTTPESDSTVWLFVFYDRVGFWADTLRRGANNQIILEQTW